MKKLLIILACTLIFLTGCGAKEETQTLTIGVMPDVGAAPFIIAKEMGYFEEEGLDVQVEVFRSAMDRDTAFQTGNLDGVMSDLLAVVFFNDNDFPVKVTSSTYGNFRMVTSPSNKELTKDNLSDLKAGLSTNTVIEFATDIILQDNNGQSVEKVAIPKIPLRLEMLANDEIDIATLPEPLASAALLKGGRLITDTEEAGYQPGVFIFSEKALETKNNQLDGFYKGYNKAVEYLNTRDSEEYFPLLVEQLSFPPVLEGQFEMPVLEAHRQVKASDLDLVNKWMLDKELTTNNYTLEDILYKY
jgi:NitT/TauT family transport system substrate-binding protein